MTKFAQNPSTMSAIQLADYMAEMIIDVVDVPAAVGKTQLGDVLVKVMSAAELRKFAYEDATAQLAWVTKAAEDGRVAQWVSQVKPTAIIHTPEAKSTGHTQAGFYGGHTQGNVTQWNAEPTTFDIGGIQVTAGPVKDIARKFSYTLLLDLTGNLTLNTPAPLISGMGSLFERLMPAAPVPHSPQSFISLAWPDMGVYPASPQFWVDLFKALSECKNPHLGVGCTAGLGRTGTVLSILTRLAYKLDGQTAIDEVRARYHKRAVETKAQEAYVASLVF